MSKFFVTGGSGFIGSSLVKKLLAKGHYVKVYDDFSRGKKEKLILKKVDLVLLVVMLEMKRKLLEKAKGLIILFT